jgi:hypothetical protein
MTSYIDSSVLLDLLVDDPRFAASSSSALKEARRNGRLAVCEVVLAEIRPALASDAELGDLCRDLGLEYEACSREAALLAGSIFAAYLANKGAARRVLPDFLVAAQALVAGATLLARDRGYYRDYFAGLDLIDPSSYSTGIG